LNNIPTTRAVTRMTQIWRMSLNKLGIIALAFSTDSAAPHETPPAHTMRRHR
jgi:hypothetical protein